MKVSSLALVMLGAAACSGPDPTARGAAPPPSSVPAPSASASVAMDDAPPAPGAPPLSERRARVLSVDLMQRTMMPSTGLPGPADVVVDDTIDVIAGDLQRPSTTR